MDLEYLTCVPLLTDAYRNEGVSAGAIGSIIEMYNDDAFEVEFSDKDKQGITIAQIVAHRDEIEAAELPDPAQ